MTGATNGSLDNIRGDISFGSQTVGTGNRVEIIDSSSVGSYTYLMDSARIYRTNLGGGSPTGSISLVRYALSSLSLVAAGQGNSFQIDGTPMGPESQLVTPIQVFTGNGNDNVNITGTTRPLNIDLGEGLIQTVNFANPTRSLDTIEDEVAIKGLGFIEATLSDQASTTSRSVKIDNSTAGKPWNVVPSMRKGKRR